MTSPLADTDSLPFRLKVAWFRDILRHPPARHHLWSLYYAGEAYVELHPLGVFVDQLPPRLGRILERHLADETRHAGLFRELLAGEGRRPAPLPPEEDLGWTLLNGVVPDVVEAAGRPGRFTEDETRRYLAFLHALELRSIGDLAALQQAADELGLDWVVATVADILNDEHWHATWTFKELVRRAGDEQAKAVWEPVRRAERRHYTRTLRVLLARFESLGTRPTGLGYLRWSAMKLAARLGLAVPLLPWFEPAAGIPRRTAA